MKTKIIPIVAVLLVLLLVGYKYYSVNHAPLEPENVKDISLSERNLEHDDNDVKSSSNSSSSSFSKAHDEIVVDRPVNGTMKGVIEVGASGFNAFVVTIDKNKNWELNSKQFGESLAIEGFATTADVHQGMKKYLATIFEKGVSGKNVHFCMSSGALKNKNSELIARAIEEKGYVVNRITAEKEGKYALMALLPKGYRNNSFVVDIGSGNTKVSFYSGATIKTFEGPGAKYYQNSNLTDEKVFEQISAIIDKVPQDHRQNCFIIGGVPFQLASTTRNADERFTFLSAPEDYSYGDNVKLKSGLNIYKAIVESSGCENFIFDWDANFTIGFLLTLN